MTASTGTPDAWTRRVLLRTEFLLSGAAICVAFLLLQTGVVQVALETGIPVAFGVLTCDTQEQAEARVEKGAEAVRTGLEMADAFATLRTTAAG